MSKSKNILFLLLALPDLNKNSNLYSDLIEEFAQRGERIYVIAPSAMGEKTHLSREKGIEILRVRTLPLFGVGAIRKGIANILLPYQFQRAVSTFYSEVIFDTIIMPTPPITLERLASKLKERHSAKVYLILRDIFPQNAVDLGMMSRKSPLYTSFRRQEKRLYALSDRIGCMSQGNINYVLKHNPEIRPEKLHILMNFQKIRPSIDLVSEDLKSRYGLSGKFVIVFGGNIGLPQKIEAVLAFAKAIETDYPDVCFLLIGMGAQKQRIESLVKENKLKNFVVHGSIPRDDYQRLVCQCDLGLVSLHERFTIPNIPSKTMSYFEAGLPVLASIDTATDYGQMLDEHQMGLWSEAGNTQDLVENFRSLYHNAVLRRTMGANGRLFLEQYMNVKGAYETIKSHIE